LNQVYANVLGRPVLVPSKSVVSLGSAIFAFLAAGTFASVDEAQDKICSPNMTFAPEPAAEKVYESLYALYKTLYFSFGQPKETPFGRVLPELMRIGHPDNAP
jgi:L-ribulokinase